MCGRFVSTDPPERLADFFGLSGTDLPEPLGPNHNVAPTTDVYGVVADAADLARHLRVYHWGLVPSWAKEQKIGQRMINARSETLAEKNSFKGPFRKHRCLVPMTGFYEWKPGEPGGPLTAKGGAPAKQPFYITRSDGQPLAVAGLWSAWRDRDAEEASWLHSCTVITTSANRDMASLHDRMPVILDEADWDQWLDPSHQNLEQLSTLLVPAPDGVLTMHPVSTAVNQVRNKGPELIDPV